MAGQPLFDNRYRYDTIYPRGRSGETLRAYDTAQQDRPVVVKRPAPQDAPPLRAAQEVNILAEKKALERLAGHPVLAALVGSGTFRAGGVTYQYIVMERAQGETLENLVLNLAPTLPPELELLHIVDSLLDLLITAHSQHVIYNDVDAKHLFWDRENYRLKVIDWGNAVFSDEANHPTEITAANDIYQVGELLYFIYQGGARLASETTPDGAYFVHFRGDVPAPLQELITRATHPNLKTRRFASLRALREALNAYREPLERARQATLQEVRQRLVGRLSQADLDAIESQLQALSAQDPAYPPLRALYESLAQKKQQLQLQVAFDVARIYLDQGQWRKAIHEIEQLLPQADADNSPTFHFFIALAELLDRQGATCLGDEMAEVVDSVLAGKGAQAARLLMNWAQSDPVQRQTAFAIAERLASLLPEVTLFRPHVARLLEDLRGLDSILLNTLQEALEPLEQGPATFQTLIERYGRFAIQLADWEERLRQLDASQTLSARAERAAHAAQMVLAELRRASENIYTSPASAQNALNSARFIDPFNPALGELEGYMKQVNAAVAGLSDFRPAPDGQDLALWLGQSLERLAAYRADISDKNFLAMLNTLERAQQAWAQTQAMLALGRKTQPAALLGQNAEALATLMPMVAEWFKRTAQLLRDTQGPERYLLNQALGAALREGYAAWDNGHFARGGEYARQALSAARDEGESQAATRLGRLIELTETWLKEESVADTRATDEVEKAVYSLFLPDERLEYERFSAQMPNEEVYLKAMKRGIVAALSASSSAGGRLLFFHYVLRGAQEVQAGDLKAADFWREAALNVGVGGKTHPLFAELEGEITRRHLLNKAQQALNQVAEVDDLPELRRALNAPLADVGLKTVQNAVENAQMGFKAWLETDYRGALAAFEQAFEHLNQAEQDNLMQVGHLRKWIGRYYERMQALVAARVLIEQQTFNPTPKSPEEVQEALERMVDLNVADLPPEYARTPRQWRDLYKAILRTHFNTRLTKREKLAEFDGYFSALFIEKHPAYRLFQRWQAEAQALPDDVKEQVHITLEDQTEEAVETPVQTLENAPTFDEAQPIPARKPVPIRRQDPRQELWNRLIGLGVLGLLLLGGFAAFRVLSQEDSPIRTPAPSPTFVPVLSAFDATSTSKALSMTRPPLTQTPLVRPTNTAAVSTPIPPSATQIAQAPSITPAPSLTATPIVTIVTQTPPPRPTLGEALSPVLPPIGEAVDVLAVLAPFPTNAYDWDANFFQQGAGGVWQLGASLDRAGSAPVAVAFSPQFMENFNPSTSIRLERVEATLQLDVFDAERIASGGVYFGLGLQNGRRQRYSAQVQVREAGLVSFGLNENGTFRPISQLPLSPVRVTLAIQRNADATLTFFVNGQQLDSSPALFALGEPVSVVLYTSGGGMFVAVSALNFSLSPYVGP